MGKRSKSSNAPSLLSQFEFFVDENLSPVHVPAALAARAAAVGATVTVHLMKDVYGAGALDLDWIPKVGQTGWLVLTKDKMIRRNEAERLAFQRAGVRAFFLGLKKATGPMQGEIYASHLFRMLQFAQRHPAPFIGLVTKAKIELLPFEDPASDC